MGQKGKQIVEIDVNEVIKDLNSAYADEWLAHYQYFLYAQLLPRHVGRKDIPLGLFEPLRAQVVTASLGLLTQLSSALGCYLGGYFHRYQPARKALLGTQLYGQVKGFTLLEGGLVAH